MGRYRKVEFTMMIFFDLYCSAISVELYYIFATLWGREQYTLYGILFIVYGILLSVTACIAVALTYFQLSSEDYRWWWRSIFSAGYVDFFSIWLTRILKKNKEKQKKNLSFALWPCELKQNVPWTNSTPDVTSNRYSIHKAHTNVLTAGPSSAKLEGIHQRYDTVKPCSEPSHCM